MPDYCSINQSFCVTQYIFEMMSIFTAHLAYYYVHKSVRKTQIIILMSIFNPIIAHLFVYKNYAIYDPIRSLIML